MKRKTFFAGMLSVVMTLSLLSPTMVSAFWPFDAFFKSGQVKGESTGSAISNIINKVMPTPTPVKDQGSDFEQGFSEEKLNKLLMSGKITEAQKKRNHG